jgi:hypothetical protein
MKYKIVAEFEYEASNKDEAFKQFEEQVADMEARGESLVEHFAVKGKIMEGE